MRPKKDKPDGTLYAKPAAKDVQKRRDEYMRDNAEKIRQLQKVQTGEQYHG